MCFNEFCECTANLRRSTEIETRSVENRVFQKTKNQERTRARAREKAKKV